MAARAGFAAVLVALFGAGLLVGVLVVQVPGGFGTRSASADFPDGGLVVFGFALAAVGSAAAYLCNQIVRRNGATQMSRMPSDRAGSIAVFLTVALSQVVVAALAIASNSPFWLPLSTAIVAVVSALWIVGTSA